jgi:hypothetical protein
MFSMNGSPVVATEFDFVPRESLALETSSRRITLRSHTRASSVFNDNQPLLSLPMKDGNILDLDPTMSAAEIAQQLGKKEVLELQESLLRFREQTDALLAQFGI